jgi:hypothetical protein
LLIESQSTNTLIVNQQQEINNQKFAANPTPGNSGLGRPGESLP